MSALNCSFLPVYSCTLNGCSRFKSPRFAVFFLCFQTWSVSETSSTDLWYSCRTTSEGYHCKPALSEGLSSIQEKKSGKVLNELKRLNVSFSFPLSVLLDWIQAVQALMILSVLFCFCSLLAFLYQLFRLVKGGRFFFTAIFQILASECDFTEGRWGGGGGVTP